MILPGLSGWDAVRTLAADSSFDLPILVHPAMLGGWLHSHSDNDGEEQSSWFVSPVPFRYPSQTLWRRW
jgi:hypothetical protein